MEVSNADIQILLAPHARVNGSTAYTLSRLDHVILRLFQPHQADQMLDLEGSFAKRTH